ncbi:hypothetical protein [Sphingomonas crocodyli]|nr:hypothetical protein [Sphingomonas crocodyli]
MTNTQKPDPATPPAEDDVEDHESPLTPPGDDDGVAGTGGVNKTQDDLAR